METDSCGDGRREPTETDSRHHRTVWTNKLHAYADKVYWYPWLAVLPWYLRSRRGKLGLSGATNINQVKRTSLANLQISRDSVETRLLPLCKAGCECSRGSCLGSSFCVAQQKACATLQHVFGFSDFRPGQLEAILAAHHGQYLYECQLELGNHFACSLPQLHTQAMQLGWSSVPRMH